MSESPSPRPVGINHVALDVDDPDTVERRLAEEGVEPIPGQAPDSRGPWGNYFQVVA